VLPRRMEGTAGEGTVVDTVVEGDMVAMGTVAGTVADIAVDTAVEGAIVGDTPAEEATVDPLTVDTVTGDTPLHQLTVSLSFPTTSPTQPAQGATRPRQSSCQTFSSPVPKS
jgi:hypothetical protein